MGVTVVENLEQFKEIVSIHYVYIYCTVYERTIITIRSHEINLTFSTFGQRGVVRAG